jgi:hypothetical protein
VTFRNAMRRLGKRPEGLNATGHGYAVRATEKRQTEEKCTRGNAAMSCQARRSPEADYCATACPDHPIDKRALQSIPQLLTQSAAYCPIPPQLPSPSSPDLITCFIPHNNHLHM